MNDLDFHYSCPVAIMHTNKHFKTIEFDDSIIILLDESLVADFTLESD